MTEPPATRFKVGDKVRSIYAPYLPNAIITEITERGFKYELEHPHVLSPRIGSQTGGESYNDSGWELVPTPEGRPTMTSHFKQKLERDQENVEALNMIAKGGGEVELLPCPFCGGPAEQRLTDGPKRGFIGCFSCMIGLPFNVPYGEREQEAWNARSSQPAVSSPPLCPVHQHLEDEGRLEVEIGGNNCVACSLNERAELLKMLAPFAPTDSGKDSLQVLQSVIDRTPAPSEAAGSLSDLESEMERDAMIETITTMEKECDELLQVARMALQQFEFQYGKRKRGWDAKFLMERLEKVIADCEYPGDETAAQPTPTEAREFDDWLSREDYGDREQLQRCWNAAIASTPEKENNEH